MEKGWTKIQTYNSAIEAEIVKQMLVENGVNAVLLNKQDSSYLFGKIEIYVAEESVEIAKQLIDQSQDLTTEDNAN